MSKIVKLIAILGILLLVFVLAPAAANVTAARYDVQGLVFMDDNLNGVWDVGEAGYEGNWEYDEELGVYRNVGAAVTILTAAYDDFDLESSGSRDLEEGETVGCTQQDLVMADGELNPNAQRPCTGTWGFPMSVKDTWINIEVAAPDGYYVTSPNPQPCLVGDDEYMDFGLAPLEDGVAVAEAVPAAEEAVAEEGVYHIEVKGTGFVPGLVFIDRNEDGVWQPGEAGYGGELVWDEDNLMTRYIGAEVTFISPAYDDFEVETYGYRELEEHEDVLCTPQDFYFDEGVNPNPMRPCLGTFGLTHAGDDVRWEVMLTVPDGYKLTSANPQYYTTGSGQLPVDFGIAPVAE